MHRHLPICMCEDPVGALLPATVLKRLCLPCTAVHRGCALAATQVSQWWDIDDVDDRTTAAALGERDWNS